MLRGDLIVPVEIQKQTKLFDRPKSCSPLYLTFYSKILYSGVEMLGVGVELLLELDELSKSFFPSKGLLTQFSPVLTYNPIELITLEIYTLLRLLASKGL